METFEETKKRLDEAVKNGYEDLKRRIENEARRNEMETAIKDFIECLDKKIEVYAPDIKDKEDLKEHLIYRIIDQLDDDIWDYAFESYEDIWDYAVESYEDIWDYAVESYEEE